MGTNVLVKGVNKKYFFGFGYFSQNNIYYPYSDVEKTFIDMVYFKEKMSEEVIKNITEKLNIKKLKGYLKDYPKRTQKTVLKQIFKN